MRIFKFVLLFLLTILLLSSASAYLAYKRVPSLNSNKAILILGKGGEGHTAPNLTDTIMVAFVDKDKKNIKFVSLPRDIWIPEMKAKLNTAYHYGAFKLASESVASVTGIPITDVVVIDFSLFKDLIDKMGGIDVNVENSFVDERYPIAGKENDLCNGDKTYKCRYEVLTVNSGLQKMDGELALKYVRSRNAVGDEGTDIAREKRQQKIIEAIKLKLMSKDVLLNPTVISELFVTVLSHVETDFDTNSLDSFGKFVYEAKDNISFLSFPENLLMVSQNDKKYDRQYVFIPTAGNWSMVQEWFRNNI